MKRFSGFSSLLLHPSYHLVSSENVKTVTVMLCRCVLQSTIIFSLYCTVYRTFDTQLSYCQAENHGFTTNFRRKLSVCNGPFTDKQHKHSTKTLSRAVHRALCIIGNFATSVELLKLRQLLIKQLNVINVFLSEWP